MKKISNIEHRIANVEGKKGVARRGERRKYRISNIEHRMTKGKKRRKSQSEERAKGGRKEGEEEAGRGKGYLIFMAGS